MSSGEQRGPRLPERAEALLADWPAAKKSDEYWEERALEVTNKLGQIASGSTPDALLAAPLPAEPDEGTPHEFQRATAAAPARPRSLAELARAVRDSKPEESLQDIAAASLSLSSRSRGAASEVAARLRAQSAQATSTPLPDKSPTEAAVAPARAPAAEAKDAGGGRTLTERPPVKKPRQDSPRPSSQARASERSRGVAPFLMAAAAALAVAAAALIVVKTRPPSSESVALGEPTPAVAPAAPPPATAPPATEEPQAIAPENLPGSQPKALPAPAQAPRPPAAGERVALRAAKPGEKPERVVLEESKVPPPPVEAAPKPAAPVDPNEPPLRPADGKSAELPDKPAAGAMQAAINSVKASAAACIAAHDQPSTAVINFGSDGRGRSVVVGGGAANTPAAGCIRSALSKAKVAPFAKDSFSVSTTIRPP